MTDPNDLARLIAKYGHLSLVDAMQQIEQLEGTRAREISDWKENYDVLSDNYARLQKDATELRADFGPWIEAAQDVSWRGWEATFRLRAALRALRAEAWNIAHKYAEDPDLHRLIRELERADALLDKPTNALEPGSFVSGTDVK